MNKTQNESNAERRRKVVHTMTKTSIGEVRDKFGACIGCMRPRDQEHHPDCILRVPIEIE
jgi:hypothetical protein